MIEKLAESQDHFILLVLGILVSAMTIDLLLAVVVNVFVKGEKFSSVILKIGLAIKILQIALLVTVLIPLGVALNGFIGGVGHVPTYTMMFAMVFGEIYSILGHMNVVDDNSKWLKIVEDFLQNFLNKK